MAAKTDWDTARLVAADKKHIWHPFTPMGEWCAPDHDPIVLVEGRGALLWDSEGREYIDGNSSIWTNIHGHNHPHINAAIHRQLERVAHTSFLGFTNPAAIELAESLVALFPPDTLTRVFYSDDGSTGIEAALRIADQFWRLKGSARSQFIAFRGGYHGDTAGAASLGAGQMFGGALRGAHFPVRQVTDIQQLHSLNPNLQDNIEAVIIEPLIQGAFGMRLWPPGVLTDVRAWCDQTGALLIVDEVMTGFGRTGTMFACGREQVIPDIMILAKGLTGGYVPLAVTLIKEKIFAPFCAGSTVRDTLYYGHSYTGNALACAAAQASIEVFVRDNVLGALAAKIEDLRVLLGAIEHLEAVSEVRQCGFVVGIELDDRFATPSKIGAGGLGAAVCRAARNYGLLTRPIRNVIVLMPPFCITERQLKQAVVAIKSAILDVCGASTEVAV